MKKRILYIQHAGGLGGSAMSLLYTMQGVSCKYESIVALARPTPELFELYSKAGFETVPWAGLFLWDHSTVAPKPIYNPLTWIYLFKVMYFWRRTQRRTLELIDYVKPDIVHLNSMPLSPCVDTLNRKKIPFIWHVREPPPDQGLRTRIIRRIMLQAQQLIFISEYDKKEWVGGRCGNIVKNFVDFQAFHLKEDTVRVRKELNLKSNVNIILYLGGISEEKGISILLRALVLLRQQLSEFVCLMPGSKIMPPASWKGWIARKILPLIGSGTLGQKITSIINKYELESVVRLMPFSTNVSELLVASNVLVFPATQPHFARPIIEAAAMGKPSIGSDLGGINELIEHNHTGLLVEPNSPESLAKGIMELLSDPEKAKRLGLNAFQKAKLEFNADHQIRKIIEIYDSITDLPRKDRRDHFYSFPV